ncbi:MAG: hypothetical protein LBQ79_11155 [Deltaproteobacteria bacterium]|jgi:hypothetical protein|nr:hypothetical protein [Deltaproteobacteria bacterium]
MKIDPSRIAEAVFLRAQTETSAAQTQKTASEEFAALLEEQNKTMGSSGPEGLKGAMELLSGNSGSGRDAAAEFLSRNSLSQLQLSVLRSESAAAPSATPQEAAQKIEETLGLLEEYAVSLGDPSNTLKDLAPLAEELSLQAGGLDSLTKKLPADDPLKELGSDTAALAAVEALKFKRGDFL